MKKLLAVLVVFTLVAGAAFADLGFGGQFAYKIDLFQGDSTEDSEVTSDASAVAGKVDANFSGDNYGGRVRLYSWPKRGWWNWTSESTAGPFAFAWWKPIDQFRFQIGHNPDGDWGAQQIGGWGYNAEAQDYVAIDNDSGDSGGRFWRTARSAGFYGGFSEVGTLFSIYPADIVTINFALQWSGEGHWDGSTLTKEVFKKFHANLVFNLNDIGVARVSFVGLGGNDEDLGLYRSAGNLYASFYLTAIENLGVDLGLSFGLPYKDAADVDNSPGLGIGLGVRYAAGDFGVKFRAGTTLGSSVGDAKGDTVLAFGILPYYNLGSLIAYLSFGMGVCIPDEGDSVTDFFLNPYIRVPVGGFNLYAGFKLSSDGGPGGADAVIKWAVPIGVNVYF